MATIFQRPANEFKFNLFAAGWWYFKTLALQTPRHASLCQQLMIDLVHGC